MATLGQTTAPNFGWFSYGLNVQNAAWCIYTMPAPGGYITSISGYFDTNQNGSATCYTCVWNGSNGALLASAAVGPVPNGSHATNAQAWWTGNLGSSLWVAGGTTLAIGFWVPQNNGMVASYASSGTTYSGTQSGSGPGTASGPSSGFGTVGAYATYTPLSAPTLSSLSPTHGIAGDTVIITGNNFQQITGVTFNGVAASFTVNSTTQITATVPSGATSGNVTVSNAAGSASLPFTVSALFCFDGANLQRVDLFAYNGSSLVLATLNAFSGSALSEIS